jgi:hypothetical protein
MPENVHPLPTSAIKHRSRIRFKHRSIFMFGGEAPFIRDGVLGALTKKSYRDCAGFSSACKARKGAHSRLCNPLRNTAGGRKDKQDGNFFSRNRLTQRNTSGNTCRQNSGAVAASYRSDCAIFKSLSYALRGDKKMPLISQRSKQAELGVKSSQPVDQLNKQITIYNVPQCLVGIQQVF